MDDKLVSIIIPSYNAESTIEKCLISILEQPYRNIEVIIVDDGSVDNTGLIISKYSNDDRRIKYICQTSIRSFIG